LHTKKCIYRKLLKACTLFRNIILNLPRGLIPGCRNGGERGGGGGGGRSSTMNVAQ
jgi:hypothetical protein